MHRNLICISLAAVNASLARVIYEYETYFPTLVDAARYRALRPINMGSNRDGCWTELSCPMDDYQGALKAVHAFQNQHSDNRIAGILCLVDQYMPLAAYLTNELGLIGLSDHAAAFVSNKYSMKKELSRTNIIGHPFAQVNAATEAKAFGAATGYPIVIKPANRAGGRGVTAVERESEIDAAFAYAAGLSGGEPVVAEVFLEGREISVEGISVHDRHQVIGVTDKMITPAPFFVEIGHTFPSRLPEGDVKRVYAAVYRALDALALMNCCWHVELILTAGGPVINEVHARLPGGRITDLIRLAVGIEMNFLAVAAALGDPIEAHHLRPKRGRTACIRYLLQREQSNRMVKNYYAVWRLPHVHDVRLYPSSTINRRDNFDRVGMIMTLADTADEAEQAAKGAVEMLEFA